MRLFKNQSRNGGIPMKGFAIFTTLVFLTALTSIPASALDAADHKFATDAAIASMAEVELANLARQKVKSEEIRQYAERLLVDHQQANEKLRALASQKNITLPKDLDAKH